MESADLQEGPGFRIREATLADLDTVMAHRRGMLSDMGFRDEKALDALEAQGRLFIKKGLEDGSFRAWLLIKNQKPVAGGALVVVGYPAGPQNPHNKKAHILNVYTEPDHRRSGCARAVMDAILAWCRAEGFPTVFLHASPAGRHLYETLGFKPTNEMRLDLK